MEIGCRVKERGETCQGGGTQTTAGVGGTCDVGIRPAAGVH
ncbi:hypothetical protein [uncultured Lamprocystis sp.]|nr:hypothetical protein [uncultured Lamprocystis sp.]